jgi:hypothetical protein
MSNFYTGNFYTDVGYIKNLMINARTNATDDSYTHIMSAINNMRTGVSEDNTIPDSEKRIMISMCSTLERNLRKIFNLE